MIWKLKKLNIGTYEDIGSMSQEVFQEKLTKRRGSRWRPLFSRKTIKKPIGGQHGWKDI